MFWMIEAQLKDLSWVREHRSQSRLDPSPSLSLTVPCWSIDIVIPFEPQSIVFSLLSRAGAAGEGPIEPIFVTGSCCRSRR